MKRASLKEDLIINANGGIRGINTTIKKVPVKLRDCLFFVLHSDYS